MAWELPYNSSYLSLYFSVRSRALASLVAAVAQVVTTLALGAFLDYTKLPLNQRARYAYLFIMALAGGCWVWGVVVQAGYSDASSAPPSLDWGDDGFGRGWALYIFWSINFSLAYNYGFWLVGLLARDAKEVVRYMSVARAAEAAGQCVASGISSTEAPVRVYHMSYSLDVLLRDGFLGSRVEEYLTQNTVDRGGGGKLRPLGSCCHSGLFRGPAGRGCSLGPGASWTLALPLIELDSSNM